MLGSQDFLGLNARCTTKLCPAIMMPCLGLTRCVLVPGQMLFCLRELLQEHFQVKPAVCLRTIVEQSVY